MSIELRPRAPRRAKISALGTYVPPRILNNADLAKMVDTSDEWIMQRLGIRERHLVEPGMATSDMAVEAARRCLAQRGVQPNEVEVVIVATVTPDSSDVTVVDLAKPHLSPRGNDLPATLVYCARASDVADVWVDGRHLVVRGTLRTVETDALAAESATEVRRLLKRAKIHS